MKWADEGTTAKERRAADRAAKELEKQEKAARKRELLEKEERELAKIKQAPIVKKLVCLPPCYTVIVAILSANNANTPMHHTYICHVLSHALVTIL